VPYCCRPAPGRVLFLLIRPQNKRAKEQREMLSKVAGGDEGATTGGILGKGDRGGEQFLTLEIASGVNVKLQKFSSRAGAAQGHGKSDMTAYRVGRSALVRSRWLWDFLAVPFVGEENALQLARDGLGCWADARA